MRKASVAVALFASTLAVSGVYVDPDRETDFTAYRSYAWHEGRPATSDPLQQRIVSAVDQHLRALGLEEADGRPDLYIVAHSARNTNDPDTPNTEDPVADWRGWGRGWSDTPHEVPGVSFATWFVDMIDARSGKLVWRAVRSGSLKSAPDGNARKIDRTVNKMFRDFPPD